MEVMNGISWVRRRTRRGAKKKLKKGSIQLTHKTSESNKDRQCVVDFFKSIPNSL